MTTASAKSIDVTVLNRTFVPDVLSFLRRHYGPQFYGADERYFNWQYLQTPCDWFAPAAAAGKIPVNAVLGEDGEVLAIHAYIPFDAQTPWGGSHGVWDVEWINGSTTRGVGRTLARYLLDRADVYAGFGMNDLAEKAFRKLGLIIFSEIPRRVAVFDRETLATLTAAAGYDEEAQNLPKNATVPDHAWYTLESTAAIPAPVLDHEILSNSFGTGRTCVWLAWRYDRHPFIKYIPVASDPDGREGVAIVRLENVFGTEFTTCRIVEFLGIPGYERALLTAVFSFARAQGSLIADYYTSSTTRATMFDSTTGGGDYGVLANPRVPYMYQPLAYNARNAMNLVVSVGGGAPADIDLSHFHATKGDSDQDILRMPDTAPALSR